MIHTRRDFLKYTLLTLGTASVWTDKVAAAAADDIPTPADLTGMQRVAAAFMKNHSVPGLSMAIAHHGRIVYEEAFGFANRDTNEKLIRSHLFRIASVTKPITSAAIFMLIEQGLLKLDDLVFGQ